METINYTEKTVALFSKLPWINIKELAKVMGTDYGNLNNQVKGEKKVSEKRFGQILAALQEIKKILP